MIILNIILILFIILIILGIIIVYRAPPKEYKMIYGNKYFKGLNPFCCIIAKFIISRKTVNDKVELLFEDSFILDVKKSREEIKYTLLCGMIKKALIIFVLTLFFCLFIGNLDNSANMLEKGGYIKKEKAGNGEKHVKVYKKIGNNRELVTIDVPEIYPGKDEINREFDRAESYIRSVFLGSNKSVSDINNSLNLVTCVPESNIGVMWLTYDNEYINDDGSLNNDFKEKSKDTYLVCKLSYFGEERKFIIRLNIKRITYSDYEITQKEWRKALNTEISNKESEYVKLPERVNGKKVSYDEYRDNKYKPVITISLFIFILIPVIYKIKTDNMIKERKRQFNDYYYIIVEKLILYIGAGLSIYESLIRIIEGFNNDGNNYVLKELKLVKNEIDNGISMSQALNYFGMRSKNVNYMKLVSLIVQNLKKGSDDILILLEIESKEAYKDKNRLLVKKGEEASVKLLLPMLCMLLIVLVIIMKAAFHNI